MALKTALAMSRARRRQADAGPDDGGQPRWPVGGAVALTITFVLLPYLVAAVVAIVVHPWFALCASAYAATTPWATAAIQRLVRFVLTGEIQPVDRTRGPSHRPSPTPPAPSQHRRSHDKRAERDA